MMFQRKAVVFLLAALSGLVLSACEGVEMGVTRIDVREDVQLHSAQGGTLELNDAVVAREKNSRLYLYNRANGGGGELSLRLAGADFVFHAGDRFDARDAGPSFVERLIPAAETGQGFGLRMRYIDSVPVDEVAQTTESCVRTVHENLCMGVPGSTVCTDISHDVPGTRSVQRRTRGSRDHYAVSLLRGDSTVAVELEVTHDNVKEIPLRSACR